MKLGTILIISIILLFKVNYIKLKSSSKLKEKGDIPKMCSEIVTDIKTSASLWNKVNKNYVKPIDDDIIIISTTDKQFHQTKYVNSVKLNSLEQNQNLDPGNQKDPVVKNNKEISIPIPISIPSPPSVTKMENPIEENNGMFNYLLQSVWGFYVLFFTLTWLKWLEEIDKSKKEQINTRYAHFEDLSEILSLDVAKYENKFVFVNGTVFIDEFAKDKLFNFDYGAFYMKIVRVVEIFDVVGNKWVSSSEISADCLNAIEFLLEDKEKFNSLLKELRDEVSVGRGSVKGIHVSEQYFKKIETSQRIKWPSVGDLGEFNKLFSESEGVDVITEKDYYLVLSFRQVNSNNVNDKNIPMIRISLLGFRGDHLSILAKIKERAFKTIVFPLVNDVSAEGNKTDEINNPPEMEVVLEISFNPVNLLLCCCLNDPPYYKELSDEKEDDIRFHNINWVSDKIMTKRQFLYEKHNIYKCRLNFYRVLFGVMIFLVLYCFPYPLFIIYSQLCFEQKMVNDYFFILDVMMSGFLVFFVIFYASLYWTNKALINVFFVGLILFWLSLLILRIVVKIL